ncbi:MepB family protein [Cytobacillus gottheilii]|uniref:MepB family protein n=1 Tax=Cytobacillus gottheilii TaxID=859144 RepID=A0ABX8F9A8_9BACI|nr:MepB family protein [Cytobacillus gottheilii]QVY59742.1 MepB family protein [Cytobacillus gottheilii]
MNSFFEILNFINENIYEPNHLVIKNAREEAQNAEYGAGIFDLNSKSVRFRVAKETPKKLGHFVSTWVKDEAFFNQAFSYEKAADLLVINTFTANRFGQFVFPKEVLLKQKILKTASVKGKMAIRVYPRWDHPTGKQAIETQKWQLDYFMETNNATKWPQQEVLKLYE